MIQETPDRSVSGLHRVENVGDMCAL